MIHEDYSQKKGIEKYMTHDFDTMGLSPEVMRALEKKGFEAATPIQTLTIPPMMEWRDIIAKAPTGTGKTFAFGIPLIEHIDPEDSRIQALILAPTRELALQICDELRFMAQYKSGIGIVTLYGGQPINTQIQALKRMPKIVVATPGRLQDHLNRRTVKLDGVQTVVLDEADRMLDMGFFRDVTRILDQVPGRRNLALLSATISREVMDIGWLYQRDPVELTVPEDVENKPDIRQFSVKVAESAKIRAISRIMKAGNYERAIVFSNTKHKVERMGKWLAAEGFTVDCLHGDIRQSIREKVMTKFRSGKLQILVATDVASRGIDVDDVDTIFNYDVPGENEYYIHRIGRTGRAKKHGVAYSFVANAYDAVRLSEIAKLTRSSVEPIELEELEVILSEQK